MQVNLPWLVSGMCFLSGLGALILKPVSFQVWLFFFGMALLGAENWLDYRLETVTGGSEPSASILLKSCIPGVWLAFSLAYARGGPRGGDGYWKCAVPIAFVVPVGLSLGLTGANFAGPVGKVWLITLLLITLTVLIHLEKTFRSSVGMTRWRIKYLVLGVALIIAVRVYSLSQVFLLSGHHPALADYAHASLFLGCAVIGIGQVRGCFGEFDIYPSRAILQGSLTMLLAGGYFIIVGLLAQWVERFGGISSFPTQALILLLGVVGLTVMFLSERFRSSLQRGISRHCRRPEHDFRKIWTEFTRRTSSVLDVATLGKNAAEVVAENFHVLGVAIFKMQSATSELELLHSIGHRTSTSVTTDAVDVSSFPKQGKPVNLEKEQGSWAETLRNNCPRKFDHGGDRLAVPLVAAERLVGMMVLTDRVNGTPYSHEEMDLIQCIGDQLAGALLNLSLTDEVLQAKELEAFQTLSAFFVHDLKNAASGLGLMLQNLPAHFEDPEFRADAVRGVERTVGRIDQMIRKLGSLRYEFHLHPQPCRLDMLCNEVLATPDAGLAGNDHLELDLQPVPEQALDPEAMRSVVTNLVTNAREASHGEGVVKISTRFDRGKVAVVVADDGCGMSADFVKSRLFRPFHTTKSKGLGIGMFQCRKIIEAHGGSISVESRPGSGSRFTILLPISPRLAEASP